MMAVARLQGLLRSLIVTACLLRAGALHAPARRVAVASHRPAHGSLSPRTMGRRGRFVVMVHEDLDLGSDLFAIVGVSQDATPADIKKAFHRKARRVHPDSNPEPEAAREFRRLVAAYETLSDPQKLREWELMKTPAGRAARRHAGSQGTTWARGARGRYHTSYSYYSADGTGTASQAWKTTGQMPFAEPGAYRRSYDAGPPAPPWPDPTSAEPSSGGQQASGGPCTMPARRSARNLEAASAAEPFIVVPPGSLRTWSNPQANWERVQVMLGTSGGTALDADLEVGSRRLDSRP